MEGKNNLATMFFVWWYKDAFVHLFAWIKKVYLYLADLFSVKICFFTLFAPWKRDQISYEGLSLKQMFEVLTLNLSSRIIGAIIKLLTILTYLITTLLFIPVSFALVICWMLYPLIIIGLLVLGFRYTFGAL